MPSHAQLDPAWLRSGWGHQVSSQDELMRAVSRIGTLEAGRRYVWRGVSDRRFRLRSSLVRHLMDESAGEQAIPEESRLRVREKTLLRHARRWGVGLEFGGLGTDLQLLATLQHHGVPTRLLDVTSNPMTAMWFACQKAQGAQDAAGVLFALDVTNLEEYATADPAASPTWGSMADPLGWLLAHALQQSVVDGRPFLLRPSLLDPRMQAQEGLFITGAAPAAGAAPGVDALPLPPGNAPGAQPLKALFGPAGRARGRPRGLPFVAVVIPPRIKVQMRWHLEATYNRSQRVLFPDVDGFANAVRNRAIDLTATVTDLTEPER